MDITVSANAKLNLYLDITGIRSNGYHDIKTVMHTVDLRDSVTVSLSTEKEIVISCDKPYLPTDDRNIAYKAAELFFSSADIRRGALINIRKRIPVGGGLGGSSTDGAAVLTGLNYLCGRPYSEKELFSLGASLGADVPFCMKKGAALCEGIGDVITPLPALTNTFAVILKPDFSLNTKNMYKLYDTEAKKPSPPHTLITEAVKKNNFVIVASQLFNAFENAAVTIRPEIKMYYEALRSCGSQGVMMSGSGSCVYGLFDSQKKSDCAASALLSKGFSAYSVRLI